MGDLERHVVQLGEVPTPMFDEVPAIPVVVWLQHENGASQLTVTKVYVEVGVLNINVTDDPVVVEILRKPQ